MTWLSRFGACAALMVVACAPTSTESDRSPSSENRSLMMARLPIGASTDLLSNMQAKLLREPLSGRVATHGFAGDGLYTLEFVGSCEGNADLVAAVTETVNAAGAMETSCLPLSAFGPGEPISFRRADDG